MDMVAICPVPAAGEGHVLGMPRPGMDMSFAARATGHFLITRQWPLDMFIALRRDWACPGDAAAGHRRVHRNGAERGMSRGQAGRAGLRAQPAALRECRRPTAWRSATWWTGAGLTVVRRSYEPVTAASLDDMPRMTSGASSEASQSAGRHGSP